jgi:hypothetical protein
MAEIEKKADAMLTEIQTLDKKGEWQNIKKERFKKCSLKKIH